MSKITQALEKAARERLQRASQQPPVIQPTAKSEVIRAALSAVGPTSVESISVGEVTIDPHIVSATDPRSPIAEQYRILKTNMNSLNLRHGSKAFMVTSSIGGEGKSVTTVNLAITLARQENLKVVLVDADMRRSSIHQWLGIPEQAKGLSTALQDNGNLSGTLVRLEAPLLTILPAGPHVQHPDELLESQATRRLIASLKAQFDVVLIDAPPVLSVADPGILSELVDGVLFVVRSGFTQRRTINEALTRLNRLKANMLGCVLTHTQEYLSGYAKYYRDYQHQKNGEHVNPVSPSAN